MTLRTAHLLASGREPPTARNAVAPIQLRLLCEGRSVKRNLDSESAVLVDRTLPIDGPTRHMANNMVNRMALGMAL